jgi:hypothetical protein
MVQGTDLELEPETALSRIPTDFDGAVMIWDGESGVLAAECGFPVPIEVNPGSRDSASVPWTLPSEVKS